MSGFELRPLSLGELLDRAFLLYRQHFGLFLGIMVIPSCLVLPARFLFLRSRGTLLPWTRSSPQPHQTAYFFGFLFISWIIYSVAQAAMTYAVVDAYLGRFSTVQGAYGKIRGRFWRVMGITFGVGIRVIGLVVLLLIPMFAVGIILVGVMSKGIVTGSAPAAVATAVVLMIAGFGLFLWFSLRYSLSLPTALIEDINASAGIRRSVRLSRGRRGQIFAAFLLGIVVTYTTGIILQGPLYLWIVLMGIKGQPPNWLVLAMSVSSALGAAIASPLLMIIMVLFYYDLRIRKEAFDLQQMMSSLPEPNPTISATIP